MAGTCIHVRNVEALASVKLGETGGSAKKASPAVLCVRMVLRKASARHAKRKARASMPDRSFSARIAEVVEYASMNV
eukprot:6184501-Pleurochrysis_carterae.AAC.1